MDVLVVIEIVLGFTIMLLGSIFIALGVLDKKSKLLKNFIKYILKDSALCKNQDIILTGAWLFLQGTTLLIIFSNYNQKFITSTSGLISLYITFILLTNTICKMQSRTSR